MLRSFRRRRAAALVLVPMLVSCGGGGDGTGPARVASVRVTLASSQITAGSVTSASVAYFDARNQPLTGRTPTFESSNPAVATVNAGGTVTGVSVGTASISATVDGVEGSAQLTVIAAPVATVTIGNRTPSLREGESLQLTATVFDAGNHALDRPVAWSSSNAAVATISEEGVVSAVSRGTTYIRAESEGKKDSVSLRVKSLNAPTITGGAPSTLAPGVSATVTGTNFSATPDENAVFVNGAAAAVTAATTTSITFTVPAATALPCVANGATVPLIVSVNGDSVASTREMQMAQTRTLAVGESILLTDAAAVAACTEYAGTGGKYLITAFNLAQTPAKRTSFDLVGSAGAAATTSLAAPALAAPSPNASRVATAAQWAINAGGARDDELPPFLRNRLTSHVRAMERENRMSAARRPAREVWRDKRSRAARSASPQAAAAVAPTGPQPLPNVGDMKTFRMCPEDGASISWCDDYEELRARVVYVGSQMIIYEDSLSPVAGTVDAAYRQIGQEFDATMYPILASFGRPLAADTDLSWYGRIIAIMSPRVNNYRSGGILGFVTSCDFFPQDPATGCPSSNVGAFFYAIVPDPNNVDPNRRISVSTWQRFIRGTLIHEAKHITAVSERYVHDANRAFDEPWLEEATAQAASEMWARIVYQQGPLADIGWSSGPQCDYAPVSATCTDPVEAILHHFQFLYSHYASQESKSILSDPNAAIPDAVIYGSSWSFARWVTDIYGGDEATFLRSITQVKDDAGVDNITTHTGQPWPQLLGKFSLASLADNYPGAAPPLDPALRLPSWNTRDVFQGMHDFLVTGNPPRPAFPRAFPMTIRVANFGAFPTSVARVTNLPGGGWANWELSGTQSGPQVLAIRSTTGGPPPPDIGLAILRVQ